MKTPREVLLGRHAEMQGDLDAIREQVLLESGLGGEKDRVESWWTLLWRELILPCRRAWGGIGLAWLLIIGLHLMVGGGDGGGRTEVTRLEAERYQRLLDEQALLRAELLGVWPGSGAGGSSVGQTKSLGPRSERLEDGVDTAGLRKVTEDLIYEERALLG